MAADGGEPQVAGRPRVHEVLLNPVDKFPVDVSVTWEDPFGIFPRMYVWWDLSHLGSILGVMISGFMLVWMVHLKLVYRFCD